MYDLIGDIHGHHKQLIDLLEKMDYQRQGPSWKHPDGRRLVFVGDYVDRGPQIKQVLETVRGCVDAGDADAIMGNHEFNAMAYDTEITKGSGDWCRKHSEKNTGQYHETMQQLGDERPNWIAWFKTLPPIWEGDGIRAVHACWNQQAIDRVLTALNDELNHKLWSHELIVAASDENNQLYKDIELVCKGLEIDLPNGRSLRDKSGIERTEARVQWWREPSPDETFGNWLMPPTDEVKELVGNIPCENELSIPKADAPITCVGHYWMPAVAKPQPVHDKVVCVDYSVAKGGHLCAYRFDGEITADAGHMTWVEQAQG